MDQDHTLLQIPQKKVCESGKRETLLEWQVKISL